MTKSGTLMGDYSGYVSRPNVITRILSYRQKAASKNSVITEEWSERTNAAGFGHESRIP